MNSVASGVAPNEVIVWVDAGFHGDSYSMTLEPGMRHRLVHGFPGWLNDAISSIEVGSNVKAAVYRRSYFSGNSRVFGDSVSYAGDYWNDAISSIVIFPKEQADPSGVILSDTAFNTITGYEPVSEFFPLPENLNDKEALYPILFDDINNNAEYVLIQGDNIEAELFKDINFEPRDRSLMLPKPNVCSINAEGEFNEYKFFRLSGCILNLEGEATSLKVRWIGPEKVSTSRSAAQGGSSGGFIPEPAGDQTSPVMASPTDGAPRIVDVSWQPNNGVIQATFDQFPTELWSKQWEMYVDNRKMPVGAPEGSPNVRPNAELDKQPTGVFIGTLPWLSSLSATDFPCCGAIKFCIPGKGCTNEVNFNLEKDGCKTASQKNCDSGVKSEAPSGAGSWGQSP
ncbi:MAG: hypothetical protein MUO26_10445 [Methanotrichaceae archaeon]|nr:hypothetical protein [Methanotrichaceae archaeon]